jgi:cellulose synthase/poly-beta-1,6-N-acetylglucosamine synthase-like glycosyltransferase
VGRIAREQAVWASPCSRKRWGSTPLEVTWRECNSGERVTVTGADRVSGLSLHNPLILVAVATRNGADTISRCIDTIVDKDYENWEIVVSDCNSADCVPHCMSHKREET